VSISFLEGRTFTDIDDLNAQLQTWLDLVANTRMHGTTKERPVDRFAKEQAYLRPLAGVPAFDVRPIQLRVVPSDSHISFKGVRYSVDPAAVGKTVCVRPEGEDEGALFSVYPGATLVGKHHIRPAGSRPVTLPEHQEKIRRLTRGNAQKAYRQRRRNPRFLQLPLPAPNGSSDLLSSIAPPVQVRPLAAYEQLLEEETQ